MRHVDEPTQRWRSAREPFNSPGRQRDGLQGVRLVAVWGSPVGFVAALQVSQASDEARVAIGRFLRLVGDAASQVGRAAPVVGVVVSSAGLHGGELTTWAADQDWHRGDFLLWPEVVDAPDVETEGELGALGRFGVLVRELIGPLDHLAEGAPALAAVSDPRVVIERLLDEKRPQFVVDLLGRLLLAEPVDYGAIVEVWASEVAARARGAAADAADDHDDDDDDDVEHDGESDDGRQS